jgi:hypothetical protein
MINSVDDQAVQRYFFIVAIGWDLPIQLIPVEATELGGRFESGPAGDLGWCW